MITKPGVYPDIAVADYFADPCPKPSFTQSLCKIVLDQSPRHAWLAHPKLNPDFVPDDPTKYDVGNVAHLLLIGRGKGIHQLEFKDWTTKEARTARAKVAQDGNLGVLRKDVDRAEAMVQAAREQLPEWGCADAFVKGHGEVVVAWEERGMWLRSMIDWMGPGDHTFYDYKTTKMSVAPQAIPRKMLVDGWDVQAAFQDRGLTAIDKTNAGRRVFRFVAQEVAPPYALSVSEIPESVMMFGRKRAAVGIELWRRCLEAGQWPRYPTGIIHPHYPTYAETQWLEREETELRDVVMAVA